MTPLHHLIPRLLILGMVLAHPLMTMPTGFAKTYQSGISITEELKKRYPQVNYDDAVSVQQGDALEMKIVTTVGEGLNVAGDEFYAKLSKDYAVNGKLLLPKGTIVHGSIAEITGAKRLARDGHMRMKFDYLITPDGREIPIEGESSTRENRFVGGAKAVATNTGYALGGGVIGAVSVLRFGGLGLVAASNGYALAGGAALGAAGGLAYNLLREGESALLNTGAEVKIKLQQGMVLPSMTMPEVQPEELKAKGLDIGILGYRLDNDPFGEKKEITLTLDVSNQTADTFSMMDMAVMDEDQRTFHASPFGDTGIWFKKILPNSRLRGNISFTVDDPTQQHYLVFYKQYTREVVSKIAINERALQANSLPKKKQQ